MCTHTHVCTVFLQIDATLNSRCPLIVAAVSTGGACTWVWIIVDDDTQASIRAVCVVRLTRVSTVDNRTERLCVLLTVSIVVALWLAAEKSSVCPGVSEHIISAIVDVCRLLNE